MRNFFDPLSTRYNEIFFRPEVGVRVARFRPEVGVRVARFPAESSLEKPWLKALSLLQQICNMSKTRVLGHSPDKCTESFLLKWHFLFLLLFLVQYVEQGGSVFFSTVPPHFRTFYGHPAKYCPPLSYSVFWAMGGGLICYYVFFEKR